MNIQETIKSLLTKSKRVAVFIRHAEKDLTNKEYPYITKNAEVATKKFGDMLSQHSDSFRVYTSPEFRCIQTANIICESVNLNKNEINLTEFLGKPGIQIKNSTGYLELYDRLRVRDIYKGWKDGKFKNDLKSSIELQNDLFYFLDRIELEEGISVFISQSETIAMLGYALNLLDYNICEGEWVPFLGGFAIPF